MCGAIYPSEAGPSLNQAGKLDTTHSLTNGRKNSLGPHNSVRSDVLHETVPSLTKEPAWPNEHGKQKVVDSLNYRRDLASLLASNIH